MRGWARICTIGGILCFFMFCWGVRHFYYYYWLQRPGGLTRNAPGLNLGFDYAGVSIRAERLAAEGLLGSLAGCGVSHFIPHSTFGIVIAALKV